MKSGKPAFHEAFISKKADPLHANTVDFPYDEVSRNLGEEPIDQSGELAADCADLLAKGLAFVTNVPTNARSVVKTMGLRSAALCWVINPGMFPGTPSATQLAAYLGIKSPKSFLTLTGEASRALGIRNRAQKRAWNFVPNPKAKQ